MKKPINEDIVKATMKGQVIYVEKPQIDEQKSYETRGFTYIQRLKTNKETILANAIRWEKDNNASLRFDSTNFKFDGRDYTEADVLTNGKNRKEKSWGVTTGNLRNKSNPFYEKLVEINAKIESDTKAVEILKSLKEYDTATSMSFGGDLDRSKVFVISNDEGTEVVPVNGVTFNNINAGQSESFYLQSTEYGIPDKTSIDISKRLTLDQINAIWGITEISIAKAVSKSVWNAKVGGKKSNKSKKSRKGKSKKSRKGKSKKSTKK
jgi:hypothetical protein